MRKKKRDLYKDLLEVVEPYLGDFTGYDEKEQAFNIVLAVKELLEESYGTEEEKQILIECPDCNGTGLYKGSCEQDGCAVVCSTCGGKGYTNFKYHEFTGKKVREGVKRVFGKTCGYVHGAEDCKSIDGRVLHFSKYGCSYEDWLNGAEPKPMEELICPYAYYNKGMGNEPLEKCKKNVGGMWISECKHYLNKEECWKEFYAKKK